MNTKKKRTALGLTLGIPVAGVFLLGLPAGTAFAADGVAPSALPDYAQGLENGPITVNVLSNDQNATDGSVSIAETGNAAGSFSLNGGNLTFTPNQDWSGTTSVNYTVTTPEGSSTAVVTFQVNTPILKADYSSITTGQTASIPVLNNDLLIGADHTVTFANGASTASDGLGTWWVEGSVVKFASNGTQGIAHIQYYVDGIAQNVSVDVNASPSGEVHGVDDVINVTFPSSGSANVLGNDDAGAGSFDQNSLTFADGTTTQSVSNGTYKIENGQVSFTPTLNPSDSNGYDAPSVIYVAKTTDGSWVKASVHAHVSKAAAPVASDASTSVVQDDSGSLDLAGSVQSAIRVTSVTTSSGTFPGSITTNGTTVNVNATGVAPGTYTVPYTATDETWQQSNSATLTITVTAKPATTDPTNPGGDGNGDGTGPTKPTKPGDGTGTTPTTPGTGSTGTDDGANPPADNTPEQPAVQPGNAAVTNPNSAASATPNVGSGGYADTNPTNNSAGDAAPNPTGNNVPNPTSSAGSNPAPTQSASSGDHRNVSSEGSNASSINLWSQAWIWILIILVIIAAAIWWLIAAARRRNSEE